MSRKNSEPPAEPATRQRRSLSGEIQAMARIDKIMTELEEEQQHLVLMWIVGKFAPPGFSCSSSKTPDHFPFPAPTEQTEQPA